MKREAPSELLCHSFRRQNGWVQKWWEIPRALVYFPGQQNAWSGVLEVVLRSPEILPRWGRKLAGQGMVRSGSCPG